MAYVKDIIVFTVASQWDFVSTETATILHCGLTASYSSTHFTFTVVVDRHIIWVVPPCCLAHPQSHNVILDINGSATEHAYLQCFAQGHVKYVHYLPVNGIFCSKLWLLGKQLRLMVVACCSKMKGAAFSSKPVQNLKSHRLWNCI